MKKLSRLLLVLGLMLCIGLTAYAEDAPAAQPTAKEPRTLTARRRRRFCPCRGCRGGAAALHHLCGKGYARQH